MKESVKNPTTSIAMVGKSNRLRFSSGNRMMLSVIHAGRR